MGWLGFLFKKNKLKKDSLPVERAPRVNTVALHNVSFFSPELSREGKPIPIYNLSVTGVGFVRETLEEWPEVGAWVQGEFRFPDRRVKAKVQIIRKTEDVIGGFFQGEAEELEALRRTIARHFSLELSALRMDEVNPELLKSEPDGSPRLFRGEENCELFFVVDRQRVARFRLLFFGNLLEGSTDRTMEFGHLSGEESDILVTRSRTPGQLVDSAVKFVENIKGLEPDHAREIIALIRMKKSQAKT